MRLTIFSKWLTAATLFFLMVGPAACNYFIEDCPKASPYFEIQRLNTSNLTFTGQRYYPWRTVKNNESIKYDSFFMRVGFEKTYYSNVNSSCGQYLYALSCKENGYLGSQIGVDTIYLISLHDYNSQYLQNDTLNNIILTNYWTYEAADFDNFFPLREYIEENKDGIMRDMFEIKIEEPPSDSTGDYSFKLIFILQNGEKFEKTTDSITLSK